MRITISPVYSRYTTTIGKKGKRHLWIFPDEQIDREQRETHDTNRRQKLERNDFTILPYYLTLGTKTSHFLEMPETGEAERTPQTARGDDIAATHTI